MRALRWSRSLAGLLALSACAGGDDPTGTPVVAGATLAVSVSGLVPLDPAVDGRYEAWVVDRAGTATSLGTIDASGDASFTGMGVPGSGSKRKDRPVVLL